MTRSIRFLLFSLLPCFITPLLPSSAFAQVVTGTPPFGSFSGGPDIINLGNNNAHLVIPVLQKSGRGLMFNYNLVYDSSVWTPVASNGTTTWQNSTDTNWGWTTSIPSGGLTTYFETDTPHQCSYGRVIYPYDVWSYTNWAYIDGFGTRHAFLGTSTYSDSVPCHTGGSTGFTKVANDGSGNTISVTGSTVNSLYASDGALINPYSGAVTLTDRNGNQITSTTSSGTTSYYDTLSSTTAVLTVSGSGTPSSPYLLTYTAPSGANASYTMKYTTYSIRTNFGCSGISEYGANGTTTANLVSEIDLPDSSKYTFAYEPTPGHSGFITGRLASVTLATGGTISYSYSGGSNGIVCADGSTATLTRTTPDGAWTYARNQISGPEWTTTFTDPSSAANQTLIYFQKDSNANSPTNNFYETQRKVYQGSTSGTLLRQWTTCYNGNTTSCTTTAVSSPIIQKNVADQFGSSGLQCQHNYYYNSGGGLTEQDDYDYGSGAYGALLRRTLITFASLPPNITAFKQTVTVKNGSGTTIAQTTYNYDETTPTATSGITQHISVSGSRGNLTSVNYPVSGLTSHSTYYDTGVLNTSQDVNGATTTYNYSSVNNAYCNWAFPTSVSEPLSMSQSFVWNCTGGVMTSLTDENSQATSTTYNDAYFWRPASVSFPDGGQTSWTYNSQTSLTTTTKMNSSQNIVSTVLLDGLGRTKQTQLSDPEGVDYSTMTYDAVGRPYQAYNPTRCSPPTTNCGEATWGYTTTAYDALSRPTSVTLQDGSIVGASYTNNTVTATDPAGKKRTTTYDSIGRLTQVNEDPSGLNYATTYSYDALGNLTNVTQNGGRPRTYVYDAMSRLTSETNPESGTVTYGYNSNGDLITRTAPAPNQTGSATGTTCFGTWNGSSCDGRGYDLLHRPTIKTYSDGTTPTANFYYDSAPSFWAYGEQNTIGRLVEATTSNSATEFSYDPLGRIAQRLVCTPMNCTVGSNGQTGQGWASYYTYDLAGDMTQSNDGYYTWPQYINQTYDTAGRVLQVTSTASDSQHPATLATVDSSVGYYAPGALRKMTFGNNLTATTAFNNVLEPCRINWNSSGTALGTCTDATPPGNLQDFSYAFNAGSTNNGNVASWSGTGQQAFTRTFGYDSLNRLSTMQETSGVAEGCKPASSSSNPYNLTWGYDAWGNRTSQSPNAGTCSFSQNVNTQNQLSSPYQYDAAGNLVNDGNHSYKYDAENRLVSVDAGNTATYVYDAFGRRVKSAVGSSSTEYIYDNNGMVSQELLNGHFNREYVRSNGYLIAEYYQGTTYFLHSDHLGSARLLTGMNQSVVQNLDYLPFGEILSSDSGITIHKFTGDERDSETNLDHTQFRQYSSQLGRWMHPDPAGLAAVDPSNPQSWNRYSYVLNDPIDSTDPVGLCPGQPGCPPRYSGPQCEDPLARANGGCTQMPIAGCDAGGPLCGGWQNFYDPFSLMAVTVVGYNITQGAFVPDPEFLGTGIQNFTVSLIFGPIAGLGQTDGGGGTPITDTSTISASPHAKVDYCHHQTVLAALEALLPGVTRGEYQSTAARVAEDTGAHLALDAAAASGVFKRAVRAKTGIPMSITEKLLGRAAEALLLYSGYEALKAASGEGEACMAWINH